MKAILPAIACLAFALGPGCAGGSGTHVSLPPVPEPSVLVGGVVNAPGTGPNGADITNGIYWKDGIQVSLQGDPSVSTSVVALATSGQDIYAVGGNSAFSHGGALWTNGIASPLTDPGDTAYTWNQASAIAVSGSDVYVAGAHDANGPGSTATYWKNGVPVHLGAGTLCAVCVSGSDVYVAGNTDGAKYWKNGEAFGLGSLTGSATVTGMALSGSGDVLVSGIEYRNGVPVALLWRNGVPAALSDGVTGAAAEAVAVSGTDVYVAGYSISGQESTPAYWKNGTLNLLSPTPNGGVVNAIALDGADVYCAGSEGWGIAVLWKNGVRTQLNQGNQPAWAFSVSILRP